MRYRERLGERENKKGSVRKRGREKERLIERDKWRKDGRECEDYSERDSSLLCFRSLISSLTIVIFSLTFFLPQDLEETPARVNESPFEKGWFMKIKLGASGKSEFDKLLDETAYKAHTSADQH